MAAALPALLRAGAVAPARMADRRRDGPRTRTGGTPHP
jgi:hypothetical protein